ncbi:MAG: CidA/LrgA family protein [Pseudomonadota bacterium]
MPFLTVITILLVYQLVGELIVLTLDLPVPGPVVGMILLLLNLIIKPPFAIQLEAPTGLLLSHLSLLFIPAGVGVMVHLARLQQEWLAISVALIISTILGLLVTAWSMMAIYKLLNWKKVPS